MFTSHTNKMIAETETAAFFFSNQIGWRTRTNMHVSTGLFSPIPSTNEIYDQIRQRRCLWFQFQCYMNLLFVYVNGSLTSNQSQSENDNCILFCCDSRWRLIYPVIHGFGMIWYCASQECFIQHFNYMHRTFFNNFLVENLTM